MSDKVELEKVDELRYRIYISLGDVRKRAKFLYLMAGVVDLNKLTHGKFNDIDELFVRKLRTYMYNHKEVYVDDFVEEGDYLLVIYQSGSWGAPASRIEVWTIRDCEVDVLFSHYVSNKTNYEIALMKLREQFANSDDLGLEKVRSIIKKLIEQYGVDVVREVCSDLLSV